MAQFGGLNTSMHLQKILRKHYFTNLQNIEKNRISFNTKIQICGYAGAVVVSSSRNSNTNITVVVYVEIRDFLLSY